ncbi:fimbrial protein [Pseudomonas mucidolens]|uniref:Pilin (Type 1 fimbria component protein) n=1 Tax=Pseudomonas mucidolens TaxID=46679 RepID=A0A1H2N8W6_9PSED|nr:fimbrial protein [Pseudomonas mucidolens]SDV01927.1 Pilin (type 1 fimbria component protein) [Pseudomonas mucidolens]SQH32403.1 fimbrial protein [Pseudomonas mucidolens]
MKLGSLISSVLLSAALWASADSAMALTCTYLDGIHPPNGSMPLQISAINVGRDVPVGTEVYRQTFKIASGQAPTAECLYAPLQMWTEMSVDSSYSLTNWSSGKYANKVYRTSIQGLGVAFDSSGGPLPRKTTARPATLCTTGYRCLVPMNGPSNFELVLIKIGDVTPGVLRGGDLPSTSLHANFRGGNTVRLLGFKMGISGSLQIVSRTCSTPDVSVPMGTHQTKTFTGRNSATGWKDFSIALNNCPAFHGTYSTNAPGWTSQSGNNPSGIGTSGSRNNNSLQFRIDPARTAITPGTGVMTLDPSAAGSAPAATGVGLQIATPNGVGLPLATNRSSGLNLLTTEGSYTIPLKARYLQTGSSVTPGPANASATFTIIYQ